MQIEPRGKEIPTVFLVAGKNPDGDYYQIVSSVYATRAEAQSVADEYTEESSYTTYSVHEFAPVPF